MRVLEAVYPRPSAIPPNPSLSIAIEDFPHNNDLSTPLFSITPIEDDDAAEEDTSAEPDVAAAAYAAALTALVTSNDQRNLIDLQLLIKIFSDPKMIERLITDYRATTLLEPSPPPPVQISRTGGASSLAAPLGGPFYVPPPNTVGPICNPQRPPPPEAPSSVPSPPLVKDINYYKSLIRQHGGERQDNLKPRNSKPRVMKPCIYFNSSRGCRRGANCSYQHDLSSQKGARSLPEVRSAKRMKLDREITVS